MSGEIASDYRHRAREDDHSFWALLLISSVGLIKSMVMTLMTALRRERNKEETVATIAIMFFFFKFINLF